MAPLYSIYEISFPELFFQEPYTFASMAIGNPYALANGGRPPVDSSVDDNELPVKGDDGNKTSLLSVTEQLQFGRQIALGMVRMQINYDN